MSAMLALLKDVNESDTRAALYYVGRFVKSAASFEENGKDIFDDEARSAPSQHVKQISSKLISIIEKREHKSASQFDYPLRMRILHEITAIEDKLGPEVTADEEERVKNFVSSIQMPRPRSKSR